MRLQPRSALSHGLALFGLLALASGVAALPASGGGDKQPKPEKLWVFVGTYTSAKGSKGIYRFEMDLASGKLSGRELAAETSQPSFLAIHPQHRFLYAVGEFDKLGDKKTGAITAFALEPKTGKLTFLNQQSSGGAGPCHLVVDPAGKNVLAANYGGGSVCALPIKEDGSVGAATGFVQHEGKSVNPNRQEAPHAHSINLDAAGKFAFAADLGLDKVLVYRFDAAKGTLVANDPPAVELAKGAGPRHFAFHPSGKYAYVINELDLTVTAMSYDAERGVLTPMQSETTVPEQAKPNYSTAEVVVHPSGKFLYGSNRGHHSIAIFTIDAKTGKLKAAGHQGQDIKTPRNFAIDPTGMYLIVANQDSDSLVVFRINQKTGALEPTGVRVDVPRPVCVRFVPVGK
jgi:6-phosphogluconolactonase